MISSKFSTSFSRLILDWKTQALTQHIFKDKVVFFCLSSVQFWYLQLDAYPLFFNVRLSALMAFILSLETLAFFSLLLRSLVSAKKIQTYFSKEIICCRIVLTISNWNWPFKDKKLTDVDEVLVPQLNVIPVVRVVSFGTINRRGS